METLCINCKWENKPECPFPEPGKYLTCDKHMYWDEPDVKADDEITTLRTENAKLLCRISELEQENGRLEGNVEGLQAQLTAKLSDETTMLKIENERLQRLQEMKAAKLDYNEAEKILITALAEYEKEAK